MERIESRVCHVSVGNQEIVIDMAVVGEKRDVAAATFRAMSEGIFEAIDRLRVTQTTAMLATAKEK